MTGALRVSAWRFVVAFGVVSLLVVADLAPRGRRAAAYGVYAGITGVSALGGGALTAVLYEVSVPALVVAVAAPQVAAIVLLRATWAPHP